MISLPNPVLKTRWVDRPDWRGVWYDKIFNEAFRVSAARGWNPRVVKLEGDLVMLDLAYKNNTPWTIHVAELKDHPALFVLEELGNAPRAAKSVYRKSVRLKHLRSQEAFEVMRDLNKADEAWAKYMETLYE